MADPSLALLRWLLAVDLPECAVLACDHAELPPVPQDAVGVRVVGCLADVSLALPAQLLACGIGSLEVVACPEHPEAVARRVAVWQSTLIEVAPASSTTSTISLRRGGPVFDLASPMLPRRFVFGLLRARDLPFDLSLDEEARGLVALRLLASQGRVQWASSQAAEEPRSPQDGAAGATSATQSGPDDRVAVSLRAQGCTACGVCVRACPHQALELTALDGTSVLRHLVDACRADQACVRLCPESALSTTGNLSLLHLAERRAVELARVPTRACPRCGANHPAVGGDLCAACRFRSANPFGSAVPPGAGRVAPPSRQG